MLEREEVVLIVFFILRSLEAFGLFLSLLIYFCLALSVCLVFLVFSLPLFCVLSPPSLPPSPPPLSLSLYLSCFFCFCFFFFFICLSFFVCLPLYLPVFLFFLSVFISFFYFFLSIFSFFLLLLCFVLNPSSSVPLCSVAL